MHNFYGTALTAANVFLRSASFSNNTVALYCSLTEVTAATFIGNRPEACVLVYTHEMCTMRHDHVGKLHYTNVRSVTNSLHGRSKSLCPSFEVDFSVKGVPLAATRFPYSLSRIFSFFSSTLNLYETILPG